MNSQMPGVAAAEIGERLRMLMKDTGLTRAQLCAQLSIATSTLANYLSAKRLPDLPVLVRLVRYFDVNLYWLLFGDQPMYSSSSGVRRKTLSTGEEVVLVPALPAALERGAEALDQSVGFFSFNFPWLAAKGPVEKMVLTHVKGKAMSPLLNDGDMVLVDTSRTRPEAGGLSALVVEGNVVVRRVDVAPGVYFLRAEDPSCPVIEIASAAISELEVLGRAIWAGRDLAGQVAG